jgi:hypothetical protein
MVVLIVAIVMLASIIKSRHERPSRHRRGNVAAEAAIESDDARRLREEVTRLRDRVAVLERIATDKNQMLEQEFERLRNS